MNDVRNAKIKDIPTKVIAFVLFLVRVMLHLVRLAISAVFGLSTLFFGGLSFLMGMMSLWAIVGFIVFLSEGNLTGENIWGCCRVPLACIGLAIVAFFTYVLALTVLDGSPALIAKVRLKTNTPHLDAIVNPVREQVIKDQEMYKEHYQKSFDEIFELGLDVVADGVQFNHWWICTPEQGAIMRCSKKHRDWR